jgi:Flp pilus assembly protein TadD
LPTAAKAYNLLPKVPAIQDTYGWALLKAGKMDKAVEILTEAARGMPDNAEVQYHLAVALASAGRKSEALPVLKKAIGGALPPATRAEATKLLGQLQ